MFKNTFTIYKGMMMNENERKHSIFGTKGNLLR